MEGELIIVSIISGLFTIIIALLMQRFWVTKWSMNFDFEKYKIQQRKQNKPIPKNPAPVSALGNVGSIINLIKNIEPEQLEAIQDVLGGGGGEVQESGGLDGLMDFVQNNPEIVKNFLGGLKRGSQGESSEQGLKGQVP